MDFAGFRREKAHMGPPPGLSQSVKGVGASHAGNKRVISESALRKERIEHGGGGVKGVGREQIEKYMCDWVFVQVCLWHKSVYNQSVGHVSIVLHVFQQTISIQTKRQYIFSMESVGTVSKYSVESLSGLSVHIQWRFCRGCQYIFSRESVGAQYIFCGQYVGTVSIYSIGSL